MERTDEGTRVEGAPPLKLSLGVNVGDGTPGQLVDTWAETVLDIGGDGDGVGESAGDGVGELAGDGVIGSLQADVSSMYCALSSRR